MTGRQGWSRGLVALAVVGAMGSGCDSADGPVTPSHNVYFVGNVYDGATGTRLDMTALTSISITYRDKLIKVSIDKDGRFVSTDPLPTWQDYMVTIEATNYRPFVSRNPGFDVPASLAAMSTGLADISTTQTFTFDAYLFPAGLTAPASTLTVNIVDDATGLPLAGKAAGTARFRPTAVSTVQIGAKDGTVGAPRASRRVWPNDEDLLTKTLTKEFKDGKIALAEGELSYGVVYEVSIYDVPGYAPFVTDGVASAHYVAGGVSSRTIQLPRSARDPLKLLSTTAAICTPPLPTATTYGAAIQLTFSEDVEIVGSSTLEDVDNSMNIVEYSTAFPACQLKASPDPSKQERGTKVETMGATITLSFNPSLGLAESTTLNPCTAPTAITSVSYNNLGFSVQPKGDPLRKVPLSTLLQQLNPNAVSTSLTCPGR